MDGYSITYFQIDFLSLVPASFYYLCIQPTYVYDGTKLHRLRFQIYDFTCKITLLTPMFNFLSLYKLIG